MRGLLCSAARGPAALLITGELGIGKTTLWNRSVELAGQSGLRVLTARGYAAESELTYAAVADLLGGVENSLLDELGPIHRQALERLLLRREPGPVCNERTAGAAFLAILEVVARDRPILLAMDDAQWIDASSRLVIGYAARRLAGRIAILAAARSPEDPATWIQLARADSFARITLGPLDRVAAVTLLEDRIGRDLPGPLVRQILRLSGGNPYHALELAQTLDEEHADGRLQLPDTLQQLVSERLNGISSGGAQVLLVAACLGAPTIAAVASAMDISVDRVVAAIEEAELRGVVVIDGGTVRFAQPLFAHGAYYAVDAPVRRALHRRMATNTADPEARARHLALASVLPESDTLKAIDAAADSAISRGARSAAAELHEMAIRLGSEDPVRLVTAADQHVRAGSFTRAEAHLEAALQQLPAGATRSFAMMLRGGLHMCRDGARAIETLTAAVEESHDVPPMQLRSLLLLSFVLGATGDRDAALVTARRAAELSAGVGEPQTRALALAWRVITEFRCGLGVDWPTLRLANALEDSASTAPAPLLPSNIETVINILTGEIHLVEGRASAMALRCRERGNHIDAAWADQFVVLAELMAGRTQAAEEASSAAMRDAQLVGGCLGRVISLACQAAVAAHRGHAEETHRWVRAAIDAAEASGLRQFAALPMSSLAFLQVSSRDYADAIKTLEPFLAAFDPTDPTEIGTTSFLPDAIEALVALHRFDEAEPLIAALEANGARLDRPWMLAVGGRGRACLLAAQGDLDGAERNIDRALVAHRRLAIPFEQARTELLIGQLHLRRRRRRDAIASFESALASFEALGYLLWADRARMNLDRCTPAAGSPGDEAALTPAERRIAERAAAGLANRDIATELFVSVKTVEQNLSRVYRKLGIRSRAQLHARLVSG